ncbi:AfsR/SARP family transcriptional regulator [Actinophytocola sp.]|uniref:AfsR/SARP family transcriptional regulator n=1 Tax=Actinophytocola sp. TaxID=1872138 RepID=UPI002D3A0CC1|nr:tetratricopeptide repeat protein [Actinophytocola sp.]HYQ62612.1 tetratricopeptide repeat protein [Actinophytocola sp.]
MSVRIAVLGPISVWRVNDKVGLGPPQQRAVLGLLALAGGQPLSRAELVDALWSDRPPPTAANTIQTYVKQLRRLLEPDRQVRARSAILPLVGDGYALRLPPDDIDVLRFRRLVASTGKCGGESHRTAALLGESLAMWRGAPFCDIPFLAGHPKVTSLVAERQATLVRYGEALITIGDAGEAVAVLGEAVATQPLNEALQALLIRAHLAIGQRSEAFTIYRGVRDRLAAELGVDPGPALSEAYLALLQGKKPPHEPVPAHAVPAQLPADVPDFTGRGAQLGALDSLVAPHDTVPVSVVSGTAGVGKTALAVHWAHRMRDRFPDGQLYVDLRGFDVGWPMSAGDALTRFLGALGVPEWHVPLDVEDRAARYRTELASRRTLVVLDNAATVEQVRPLLPGTASCAVVVTSRDSLAGLVSRHGARRLELDLLPLDDAVTLLRRLIGPGAEPAATATLAAQCARLPLALRVAAELAITHDGASLPELVDDLADRHGRLNLLDAGSDHHTKVRAVFSWSYRRLPADVARAFRLFALYPGDELDPYGAAALFGTGLTDARRLLAALSRAHLIRPAGPDRYGIHDLLRAYAVQRGDPADRHAALTRLFDYFVAAAGAAARVLEPSARHPATDQPVTSLPAFADAGAARAWLDAERPTLVTVIDHTARHGWPAHTERLAASLYRYLDGGHYPDALRIYTQAAEAARRAGDQTARGHALINLGSVYRLRGRYHVAAAQYRRACTLHRRAGDARGQARALAHLGTVLFRLGQPASGALCQQRALGLYRQAGDQTGQARVLTNLGIIDERLGRFGSARQHHQQALARYRLVGDRVCEAVSLSRLGLIDARQGGGGPARATHERALAYFRTIGHRRGEAHLHTNLAALDVHLGRYESAVRDHREALDLFQQIGDPHGEITTRNGLGDALRSAGRPAEALAQFRDALTLAVETCDRDEQARAHGGMARTHQVLGQREEARRHWRQALALYTAFGAPEAADARAGLAALDPAARTGEAVSS